MEEKLIYVGDKSYTCKIAKTMEDKQKGLQDIEFLPPDEGMLFEVSDEDDPQFWMKDTKIPLDQIAIDENDEVIMVYPATPLSEELISFAGAKYLLEVNANSGIKVGDDFEIDDEDLNKYVMKVLDPNGGTQFLLQGGERIFSRNLQHNLLNGLNELKRLNLIPKNLIRCVSDQEKDVLENYMTRIIGKLSMYLFLINIRVGQ